MCVLPIRGRPLPRPVPVLDLTLLMFEWLLIFQLFSQPAMTQLIRKYDSSLGDWIPLLQNCGILTQISRRHISCFSHSPSNNQGGSPWWASISLIRGAKEIVPGCDGSWPRAWAETSAAPTGGESERQLLPDPVCFHSTSRAGRSCRQWKRHLDNSLGPS